MRAIVLVLMSAFAVCLIADEWIDMRHAWQDMQIEATAEIEVEDFEWDEFGGDNGNPGSTSLAPAIPSSEETTLLSCRNDRGFISDKLWLGLVRRYAPRKVLPSCNCVLT